MMAIWLQNLIVGGAAAGAMTLIVLRMAKAWRPGKPGEGCPSCASGSPCAPRTSDAARETVHSVVLIRSKSR